MIENHWGSQTITICKDKEGKGSRGGGGDISLIRVHVAYIHTDRDSVSGKGTEAPKRDKDRRHDGPAISD